MRGEVRKDCLALPVSAPLPYFSSHLSRLETCHTSGPFRPGQGIGLSSLAVSLLLPTSLPAYLLAGGYVVFCHWTCACNAACRDSQCTPTPLPTLKLRETKLNVEGCPAESFAVAPAHPDRSSTGLIPSAHTAGLSGLFSYFSFRTICSVHITLSNYPCSQRLIKIF